METVDRSNPNREHFQFLLTRIRDEINRLKSDNRKLSHDNLRLREEIEKMKNDENDAFSHVGESERIMIKNQIDGLINKINQYISD